MENKITLRIRGESSTLRVSQIMFLKHYDEKMFANEEITIPSGRTCRQIREEIALSHNKPLEQAHLYAGKHLQLLSDEEVLTTAHFKPFLIFHSPANNNINNFSKPPKSDESGEEFTLQVYHAGEFESLQTKWSYTVKEVKGDFRCAHPELTNRTDDEILFFSEVELNNNEKLIAYKQNFYSAKNNNYSVRVSIQMLECRGFDSQFVKATVAAVADKDQKAKLLEKVKSGKVLNVFPLQTTPPLNYEWVMSLVDYSEASERNSEYLTERQREVINMYTGNDHFMRINFLLSTLSTPKKEDFEFVRDLILACCDSFQKTLPTKVYRYCNMSEEEVQYYRDNCHKVVCIPSFLSTSRVELSHFGNVKFEIALTKGLRRGALEVGLHGFFGEKEQEILLCAFSFFEILGVTKEGKKNIIQLAYRDAIHHYRKSNSNAQ